MRTAVPLLGLLLLAGPARAETCKEAPPPAASADRSLSDVPYEPTEARTVPCPTGLPTAGLEPHEGWTAEPNPARVDAARIGMFGAALGSLLLLSSANFAFCARHGPDQGSRDFCNGAKVPTLIGGLALGTLGFGTLAVTTWVVPSSPAPDHAAISGGVLVRWAMDVPRR